MKKEIKVTFRTLTPLWTGDAWGDNKEIRPSSIMGSLRFWFEVICYFAGITKNGNYKEGKLNDDLNEKEFKEKLLKYGADFEGIDKSLAECEVSLPSRVFGCTGWKGWIRINNIKSIENDCFGDNLNLIYGIIINKKNDDELKFFDNKNSFNSFQEEYLKGNCSEIFKQIENINNYKIRNKKINKEFKKYWSIWFFNKTYFYGKFEITFEIEKEILEPIFYPLLTFIEKYGFLGGKWNIGYGRVKIESVNDELWKNEYSNKKDNEIEFKFNDKNSKKISELVEIKNDISTLVHSYELLKFFLGVDSFYCSKEREFQEKITNLPKKIKVTIFENDFSDFQTAIQKLVIIKAKIRSCLRPHSSVTYRKEWNNFRHRLLGTTSNGLEGTKIIPCIFKKNGKIRGGLVSITGVINININIKGKKDE